MSKGGGPKLPTWWAARSLVSLNAELKSSLGGGSGRKQRGMREVGLFGKGPRCTLKNSEFIVFQSNESLPH